MVVYLVLVWPRHNSVYDGPYTRCVKPFLYTALQSMNVTPRWQLLVTTYKCHFVSLYSVTDSYNLQVSLCKFVQCHWQYDTHTVKHFDGMTVRQAETDSCELAVVVVGCNALRGQLCVKVEKCAPCSVWGLVFITSAVSYLQCLSTL